MVRVAVFENSQPYKCPRLQVRLVLKHESMNTTCQSSVTSSDNSTRSVYKCNIDKDRRDQLSPPTWMFNEIFTATYCLLVTFENKLREMIFINSHRCLHSLINIFLNCHVMYYCKVYFKFKLHTYLLYIPLVYIFLADLVFHIIVSIRYNITYNVYVCK